MGGSSIDRAREEVGARYQLLHLLGSGAGGDTYEAVDPRDGARVAIKRLSLENAQDWKSVELFEREARVLGALRHPSIPALREHFKVESASGVSLYLVHDFAPGRSLHQWIQSGWRPDEQEARRIASFLLDVLGYLHTLAPPVIHRDVKPANVVRGDDGRLHLVDFGGVRDSLVTITGGSTVVGTYGFMAPEQFRGHAVAASDLYGVAATVVFLLCGRAPTELPQAKLKADLRSAVRASPALLAWLDRALQPAPEDRFGSALEAARALHSPAGAPQRGGARRGRLFALLAVLVVLVAGTGGIVAYERREHRKQVQAAKPVAARPRVGPLAPRLAPEIEWLGYKRHFQIHQALIFGSALSPDDKTLLTGSEGSAKLTDLATGDTLRVLPGHDGRVCGVAFTNDGKQALTAGGSSIKVWDVSTGNLLRTIEQPHPMPVVTLELAPDGRSFVTSGRDGSVKIWDFATGKELHAFNHGTLKPYGLAISPDGKTIATGGIDGTIRTWSFDGAPLSTTHAHATQIGQLRYSPDGLQLASGSNDRIIHVAFPDGAKFRELDVHEDEIWALAFSPDGRILVSGTKDKSLAIVNPLDLSLIGRQTTAQQVMGIRFLRSGRAVVVLMGGGAMVYTVPFRRSGTVVPEPAASAPATPPPSKSPAHAHYLEAMRIMMMWPSESLDGAQRELDEASKLDAKLPLVWVGRAQLALKEGFISGRNYEPDAVALARKHLERAATLGPKDADWYAILAWTERAAKRPDEARDAAKQALALSRETYSATLVDAFLDIDAHAYDDAIKKCASLLARTRRPEIVRWSYVLLELAYEGAGDIDATDAAYARQIALAPKDAWAHGNRAHFLLYIAGEADRAIDEAERALELMDYGAGRHVLASAHARKGDVMLWGNDDPEGAMRRYETALRVSPRHELALYGRAAVHRLRAIRNKDPNELRLARADMKAALAAAPESHTFKRALEELDSIDDRQLAK